MEPSAYAAGFAREEFGLEVIEQDLLTADLEPGGYDAIALGDVIEHLTDPLTALERIAELLAPGGVLYLTIPDSGSRLARRMGARWWSVIPTHVQYFSRASIALLLRRAGFAPLRSAPRRRPSPSATTSAGSAATRPRLARVATRALELVGLADRMWTPDFRDRMAVVARRPE